ncbi:MAG: hypothetical protein J5930_11840 [Treponema sp.]|nr:hypothetical protein [Treponema sp.]
MTKSRSLKYIALLAFAAILVSSCRKEKSINVANLESLSLTPGVEWAVVQEPYAAFRKGPSYEESVVSQTRRGEVLQVVGKSYVTTGSGRSKSVSMWYKFEEGWLDERSIILYDNRLKAQKASDNLLSK